MKPEPTISAAENDAHLDADGLSEQLKLRSARGGALMIVSYAIQLFIGIGGTAVLARLLTPRDFGYLAMVATLVTFVMTLREFLLSPTVYQQELNHAQASGLFWINAIASLGVALGVAAMAPIMGWFFHEPRVMAITLAMSLGIFVGMLGMLHIGLLRRQMRFGAIGTMEIGATLAGVVVGVSSARMGASYWALVFQQLTVWVWQSGAAWMLCPWRPAHWRAAAFSSDEGIRSMLRYGQSATASRIITYASRNIDAVLIGHFLGANILGLYQKAYQWSMTPFWQILIPITPVAVSSLSRLQDDPGRYRLYARTILLGMFGLALPGTALLMVEADAVIRLLMGEQWLEAIPMLRVLSIGAYFSVFSAVMLWLYLSEGRTGDQLRWSLISSPVTVLAVCIGLKWNAIGVAWGFTIASVLLAYPAVWYCLRRSTLSGWDYLHAVWRPVVASILAGVGLLAIRRALQLEWHVVPEIALFSSLYSVLYAALWLALPGGWASLQEFLRQLRELRSPRGLEPLVEEARGVEHLPDDQQPG